MGARPRLREAPIPNRQAGHGRRLLEGGGGAERKPLDEPYTAVVVDEVQDLSCAMVRMLHLMVGDRPDGLLLIGDGQQSVYPGGFTLRKRACQ